MWKDGLRVAAQHPWFGVGMDSIHRHWQEWNIQAYQRFPHLKSHFHSTYIQLAAECGLAVLAVWLWFLAAYLTMLWKLISRSDPGRPGFEKGFVLGLLAATVAFIAAGVVHYTLGDAEVMIVFWFLAGLSTAILIAQSPANLTSPNRT
jgi:O-antigen ligase